MAASYPFFLPTSGINGQGENMMWLHHNYLLLASGYREAIAALVEDEALPGDSINISRCAYVFSTPRGYSQSYSSTNSSEGDSELPL